MKYREIGTSGIQASVIALGTWGIGGGELWQGTEDEESIKTIRAAIDAGINLLDTAPVYGFGHSEEVVGKAIQGLDRDKLVISTKCGLWWNSAVGSYFNTREGHDTYRSLRPETIRVEVEDSLRRLKCDYIDIYHTHWQAVEPDKTPVSVTMEALLQLQQEGKIKTIAPANADAACLQEYLNCGRIDACQSSYSMLERSIEKDVLPFALKNNLSVLAYSPLYRGLLTGKISRDSETTGAQDLLPWMKTGNRERVVDMLDGWKSLAEEHNASIAQLVLAWTLEQPGITHVLCGARKIKNAIANAEAADVTLSEKEVAFMSDCLAKLGSLA